MRWLSPEDPVPSILPKLYRHSRGDRPFLALPEIGDPENLGSAFRNVPRSAAPPCCSVLRGPILSAVASCACRWARALRLPWARLGGPEELRTVAGYGFLRQPAFSMRMPMIYALGRDPSNSRWSSAARPLGFQSLGSLSAKPASPCRCWAERIPSTSPPPPRFSSTPWLNRPTIAAWSKLHGDRRRATRALGLEGSLPGKQLDEQQAPSEGLPRGSFPEIDLEECVARFSEPSATKRFIALRERRAKAAEANTRRYRWGSWLLDHSARSGERASSPIANGHLDDTSTTR